MQKSLNNRAALGMAGVLMLSALQLTGCSDAASDSKQTEYETEVVTEAVTEPETNPPVTEGLLALSARILRGGKTESADEEAEETLEPESELLSEETSEAEIEGFSGKVSEEEMENLSEKVSEEETERLPEEASEAETEALSEEVSEAETETEGLPEEVSEEETERPPEEASETETEALSEEVSEEQSEKPSAEVSVIESETLTEGVSGAKTEELSGEGSEVESEESFAEMSETDEINTEIFGRDGSAVEDVIYMQPTEHLSPLIDDADVQAVDVSVQDTYPLALLERSLRLQLSRYDGAWSVYVKDLTSGESIVIHDQPMRSASIMKLFVLGAVYDRIDADELERSSELVEWMSSMIRASSNTAANELIKRLGGGDFAAGVDVVNAYIQTQGYSDTTQLYNGFEDESYHINPDMDNQTSVKDVGDLLERIYTRSFGRRAVCNEVEEWLLGQGTRYKIPKALPDGVLCGNKTGETDSIENDCAVIYTTKGDYLLCVMSSDWADKTLAQERVTAVSAAVYKYFRSPEAYISSMLLYDAGVTDR